MNIGKTNKILIIEPSEQTREMLVEIFKNNNFKVLEAGDGVEGLMAMRNEEDLDIIMTGLNMPRINGLEFMNRKNKDTNLKDIPVVAYDNINSEEEKALVFSLGAKDFIEKSTVRPDELVNRITKSMLQGDYLFQVDPYALDAQEFINNRHMSSNFECFNCGAKLAIRVTTRDGEEAKANIICPECGEKYL
jgi:CheY-like chemotaxis protein/predicted RNA-binding Zn-ribbon protein involved in translation (DUF1610 family)